MTWSYGSSLATDKDTVRFHIGDTDPDDPQLHDEEITALLTSEGGVMRAAIRAAEAIAARYARRTDFRVSGELHQSASQMYQHYLDLAVRLRRRQSLNAIPYAGGISNRGQGKRGPGHGSGRPFLHDARGRGTGNRAPTDRPISSR
jgi:hypothetical protein